MTPRREFAELAHALDEIEPKERAQATRVITSALISLLPQDERQTTLDFLAWRARQDLS